MSALIRPLKHFALTTQRTSMSHVLRPWFCTSLCVLLLTGWGAIPGAAQIPITGQEVSCSGGTASGYSCENVDLLSYLPIWSLGGGGGVELNDIWGWTDSTTGKEYALVGRTDGVAFVDVSTPTDPVYLGELPSHTESSSWRDIKVYKNHAYVVSEASVHGLQVFDLTQLRSVNNPPVTFSETAHYGRFQTAHNVVVNRETGFAYVVGIQGRQDVPSSNCGPGLHMINIQVPDQPNFAGCYTDSDTGGRFAGYTHDAQCVVYRGPDSEYKGQEICFNANERQMNIADVTDKDSSKTVSNTTYPSTGYTHQAWLTEDHRYLLVDDETDERGSRAVDSTRTLVFEISDLDNPVLVTQYTGTTPAIDHNQYVRGAYSYQANYEAGLRILDVSDPANPGEAAYFDTFTKSNAPAFNGAWSNYPFFESGIVVVSSIGEGLFVLEPNLERASILSFDVKLRERKAVAEWLVSALANTDRMVVERQGPGTRAWQMEGTIGGQDGTGTKTYRFVSDDLEAGVHRFRVRHLAKAGRGQLSPVDSVRVLPERGVRLFGLSNPVHTQEQFQFVVQQDQRVRVSIYDLLGRQVAQVYDGSVQAGMRKTVTLSPRSSGMYFLRFQGSSVARIEKFVVTR